MDTKLLLSDEEYLNIWRNYPVPYMYEVFKDGQTIFYFGVKHSRDLQDKQWDKLEKYWNEFLRKTQNQDRIILLEGNRLPDNIGDRDYTITNFGEAGLLYYLAKLNNISVVWPELSILEEAEKLKKHFDFDLVTYFFFARSAGAWLRASRCENFNEILKRAAEITEKRLSGAPISVEQYSAIHKNIFHHTFTEKECDTIIRAATPVYHDSVINDIARFDSRIRNEKIILETEKLWNERKSIFMLFGSAHAVIQERALRSLVN